MTKERAQATLQELRNLHCISMDSRVFSSGEFVYIPIVDDCAPRLEGYDLVEIKPRAGTKQYLPQAIRGSYDRIGDIAIIKLRNRERAIELGKSLLKSKSGVTAVWQDTGIQGEFRTRKLTWLAGEEKTVTIHTENQAKFILDVSKVYFSPRLATERMKVARTVQDGEQIIDMFAGIGPFAILIARDRKAEITCIDSNPDAIFYMKESMKLNKLKGKITPVLGQAESVIRDLPKADRIIMNLPHDSMKFLGHALRAIKDSGTVHLYSIGSPKSIEENMEILRDSGFTIIDKRIVHGYSPLESLVSISMRKTF